MGISLKKFGGNVHHLDHELSLQSGDQKNSRTVIFEDVDLLNLIFDFNSTNIGCVPTLTMNVLPSGRGVKEVPG